MGCAASMRRRWLCGGRRELRSFFDGVYSYLLPIQLLRKMLPWLSLASLLESAV